MLQRPSSQDLKPDVEPENEAPPWAEPEMDGLAGGEAASEPEDPAPELLAGGREVEEPADGAAVSAPPPKATPPDEPGNDPDPEELPSAPLFSVHLRAMSGYC